MNCDGILRFVVFVCSNHPHALYHTHPTIDSSENRVLVIEPRCWFQCNEELAVSGIAASQSIIVCENKKKSKQYEGKEKQGKSKGDKKEKQSQIFLAYGICKIH